MPTLPSRFPARKIPRADFRDDTFRKMIWNNGMNVSWELRSECPCAQSASPNALGLTLDASTGGFNLDLGTDQARDACPTCGGIGYYFHSEQNSKVLFTRAENEPARGTLGEVPVGSVYGTVLPEHRLNVGDRLTAIPDPDVLAATQYPVVLYRETKVFRGEAVTSVKYPISSVEQDTDPAISLGVVDLRCAGADGTTPLDGGRVEGVDFTVVDGDISWITPPLSGAQFSISYYAAPVYVVQAMVSAHRDTFTKVRRPNQTFKRLPLRYVMMPEFLSQGEVTHAS